MWGTHPLLAFTQTHLPPPNGILWFQRGLACLGLVGCSGFGAHLEVRKVLRHKIVDLADGKAPGFTVLQGHEDEDAEGRESSESLNL